MFLLAKLIAGSFYLLQDLAKSTFGQGSKSASGTGNAPVPEAKKLLDEAYVYALSEYGGKGFEFWRELIAQKPMIIRHPNDPRKGVGLSPIWEPDSEAGISGPIMVRVFLLHLTGFGSSLPIRSFLVYPDGTIVRSGRDR